MISEKPWKWDALGRFALGVLGALSVGMLLNTLVSTFFPKLSDNSGRLLMAITTLLMEMGIFGCVGLFLWEHRMSVNQAFGLADKPVKAIALGVGGALVALPLGLLQEYLVKIMNFFHIDSEPQLVVQELQDPHMPLSQKILFGIVAILVAPVIEECVFRGILYPIFKQGGVPFMKSSLREAPAFAAKLKQPSDPLTTCLSSKLSEYTRELLESRSIDQLNPESLRILLLQELSLIIKGELLYTPELFHGVTLRSDTKRLLAKNPQGDNLMRLNRMLLEDAYPVDFKRNGHPRLALVGVSILFGLVHANALTFLPLTLLGMLLVLLYEVTDNLLASITTHSVFNAVNFLLLIFIEPVTGLSKHIK